VFGVEHGHVTIW